MKPKKRWRLAAFFVLVVFCGCGEVREYVDMAADRDLSPAYFQALNAWTREQTVYSQFETRIRVVATLQSPEFRKAYVQEYARNHDWGQESIRMREEAGESTARDFLEFKLYVYTPEKTDNDFDGPRSIWTVFLVDGQGRKTTPREIRRIDDLTATTLAFYPYVRPYYGIFYSVKFQPPAEGEALIPLRLVLTSVKGRAELAW